MHDPGDENDGAPWYLNACPICEGPIKDGGHCFPWFDNRQIRVFEANATLEPDDYGGVEVFRSCKKPACIDDAAKIVKQHNLGGGQKQHAVFKRWHYPKEYR